MSINSRYGEGPVKNAGAAVLFVLICIALGPLLGLVMSAFLNASSFVGPLAILQIPDYWKIAYLLGAPIALAAALLFLLFTMTLKWARLPSVLVAALVPVALIAVWMLARSAVSGQSLSWYNVRGTPVIAVQSVIAVFCYWLVARCCRIVR